MTTIFSTIIVSIIIAGTVIPTSIVLTAHFWKSLKTQENKTKWQYAWLGLFSNVVRQRVELSQEFVDVNNFWVAIDGPLISFFMILARMQELATRPRVV